jgi:DnaJ like chaperone protein
MGKLIGAIVGAGAGLALGGLWWALLPLAGVALGHLFDTQTGFTDPEDPALHERGASAEEIDRAARLAFSRAMAPLFVRVAEVDGPMTREEAAAIRSFFADGLAFDAGELEQVRQALQDARLHMPDLVVALHAAREHLRPSERSLLLYSLGRIAAADRPVSERERNLLEEIAHNLGLDADVAAAMLSDAASPRQAPPASSAPPELDEGEAYRRLGLSAGASEADVKKAYRALAQKLHPDKVQHLGPRAVELAGRAFAEVNLAYEHLRRGFSS